MTFTVRKANTHEEVEKIIALRYRILRAPWNQPASTATDTLEEASINGYILSDNGEVVACGRLQENDNKIGQIRFMAVDERYQGQGLGKLIVTFLEKEASHLKLKQIELQARENAVKFYESLGYKINEKTFLLWDQIQHYLMTKKTED